MPQSGVAVPREDRADRWEAWADGLWDEPDRARSRRGRHRVATAPNDLDQHDRLARSTIDDLEDSATVRAAQRPSASARRGSPAAPVRGVIADPSLLAARPHARVVDPEARPARPRARTADPEARPARPRARTADPETRPARPDPWAADPASDPPIFRTTDSDVPESWLAERAALRDGGPAPGRRTVTIRGRGDERYVAPPVTRAGRPRSVARHERPGFRGDRTAMWAVLLCVLVLLAAVASAHGAVLH